MKKNEFDSYDFDVIRILKLFWHYLWVIILCGAVCLAMSVSYAKYFVTPQYSSSIMVYVNNKSSSGTINGQIGGGMSSSDLSVAQSLVDSYIVILGTRTTLEKVIETAKVDYTYEELSKMVSAEAVNDTEIFRITVTTDDAKVSKKIANSVARVLPDVIGGIIIDSSAKIVEKAVVNETKVSPNYMIYGILGLLPGLLLGCAIILIRDIRDDIIRNEDYLLQNYNVPVLAVIPNLSN